MNAQNDLSREITQIILRALEAKDVDLIQAAVAYMGVAAVALACLSPAAREAAALVLEGWLLERANERAKEIRSGDFDLSQAGH